MRLASHRNGRRRRPGLGPRDREGGREGGRWRRGGALRCGGENRGGGATSPELTSPATSSPVAQRFAMAGAPGTIPRLPVGFLVTVGVRSGGGGLPERSRRRCVVCVTCSCVRWWCGCVGGLPRLAVPYRRRPAAMAAQRRVPHGDGATQGERERARVGGESVGALKGAPVSLIWPGTPHRGETRSLDSYGDGGGRFWGRRNVA